MKKIVFLTSWIWEGAYILKTIVDRKIPLSAVIVQSPWWNSTSKQGYSAKYIRKFVLDRVAHVYSNRYFSLRSLCRTNKIEMIEIADINNEIQKFKQLNPDLIVVAGSKIIKKPFIKEFENKIYNFHTGILPNYRGPYSEFWAIYNKDYDNIGTTIHILDEGIDTGPIIKRAYYNDSFTTPEDCHINNAKMGAKILCDALNDYLKGNIKPVKQDEKQAQYFSSPTKEQFNSLQERLKKKFNISFAE